MDILHLIEEWILLHAAKNKYAHVLCSFSQKVTEPLSNWFLPCVLEVFVLHQIVKTRDVNNYEAAIPIVLGLYPAISETITPSVVARVVDAMKIVVLFELLKENHVDQKVLVEKINEYFPRAGTLSVVNVPSDLRQRLTKHCAEYRTLFLSLSANPEYCHSYMTHNYHKQFGEQFERRLAVLVQWIVEAVESKLPMSVVEKILHDDAEPSFSTRLSQFKLAAIELLLDYCANKDQLTEDDCIEVLDRLRPSLSSGSSHDHLFSTKLSQLDVESNPSLPVQAAPSPSISTSPDCVTPMASLRSSPDHALPSAEISPQSNNIASSSRREKRKADCLDVLDVNRETGQTSGRAKRQAYWTRLKRTESSSGMSSEMSVNSGEEHSAAAENCNSETLNKSSAEGWVEDGVTGRSLERSSQSSEFIPIAVGGAESMSSQSGYLQISSNSTHDVIVLSDDEDTSNGAGNTPDQINTVSSTSEDCGIALKDGDHLVTPPAGIHDECRVSSDENDDPDYDSQDSDDPDVFKNIVIDSSSPESSIAAEEQNTLIVPSSYSVDKFSAIACSPRDVIRQTLPSLDKHLHSSVIRNCIIKLRQNKIFDVNKHGFVLFS